MNETIINSTNKSQKNLKNDSEKACQCQTIEIIKAISELLTASSPICCFILAACILLIAVNSSVTGETLITILGLAGGAITAGAGLAQAPLNNPTNRADVDIHQPSVELNPHR